MKLIPILLLINLFLIPGLYSSDYLYGIHFWNSSASGMMNNKTGWTLEIINTVWGTTAIDSLISQIKSQSVFTPIVRINYNWGETIPSNTAQFDQFATDCANIVKNLYTNYGVKVYQIGNEMNLDNEYPPTGDGKGVPASTYVQCFNKVYMAIKAAVPQSIVLIGPPGIWNIQGPINPGEGGIYYDVYFDYLVKNIGANCDGYALHAYGLHTEGTDNYLQSAWKVPNSWGFDCYITQMKILAQYSYARTKPVYITEANTFHGYGNDEPAYSYPAGWLQQSFQKIDDWNYNRRNDNTYGQQIYCICWFVYADPGGWSLFALNGNTGKLPQARDDFSALTNSTAYKYKTSSSTSTPTVTPITPYTNLTFYPTKAREIFVTGKSLNNRANVFSKVGDSITAGPNSSFLSQIGRNDYDMADHSYLQPTVNFFSQQIARENNLSWNNVSLAAANGWGSTEVLNPVKAEPTVCASGESPLACEYRFVNPSVSLIMIGTNDAGGIALDVYRVNLRQIVEYSIQKGVIPVLFTIPPRNFDPATDNRVYEFNTVIKQTATEYQIPLIDYWTPMFTLPNFGLKDGIHPSEPPDGKNCTLTTDRLQYGAPVRNLMAIQMLDALLSYDILTATTATVANDSTIVTDTIPSTMLPGETKQITVTIKNSGTNTWSGIGTNNTYRLGASGTNTGSARNNEFIWSNWSAGGYSNNATDQRSYLSGTVTSGNQTTITFSITAPATVGVHYLEARMVQDGVSWFGNLLSKTITVSNTTPTDTTPPLVPTLVTPINGYTTSNITLTFDWTDVTDVNSQSPPVSYELQVSNDIGFGVINHTATTTNSSSVISNLSSGLFYWRVRAKDNVNNLSNWTSSLTFKIDTSSPTTPIHLSPANGTTVTSSQPNFDWSDVTDTTGVTYNFQIDVTSGFSTPILNVNGITVSGYIPTNKLTSQTYYWRVKSTDGMNYTSLWSIPWRVNIATETGVDNTAPSAVADLSVQPGLVAGDVNLRWSAPGDDGNTGTLNGQVRIQYAITTDVTWSINNVQVIISTTQITPGTKCTQLISVTPGSTFYFRLWTSDESDNWSSPSNLANLYVTYIDTIAPTIPQLNAPFNNVTFNKSPLTFTWTESNDNLNPPVKYNIQVDNNPDFSTPEISIADLIYPTYTLNNLDNGIYYWHVRAYDNLAVPNYSGWSATYSFKINKVTYEPLPGEVAAVIVNPAVPGTISPKKKEKIKFKFKSDLINSPANSEYVLRILDLTGTMIKEDKIISTAGGEGEFSWEPTTAIPPGVYVAYIEGPGVKTYDRFIIGK